jgi:hypothetical protein
MVERNRRITMKQAWTGALLLLALAAPSAAQQAAGRFTFQPIEGGLLRLDGETGQVSHCLRSGESYACRAVADDRAALQEEIERLRRENDALRQAAGRPQPPGPTGRLQLPSEEEIDKAMGLFETMMRRMLRAFRDEAPQPAPNRL